ncbi:MAG: hypothetical protein OXU64_13140 [Gemmatimonadota bacterium]|nr:hypothetical protein [Gemmatimonadota bacterium]
MTTMRVLREDILHQFQPLTIARFRGHLAEYGVVAPQGRARIGAAAGYSKTGSRACRWRSPELGWLLLDRIGKGDYIL